jgi:fumarate reductase flavoprotein subunit
MMTKRELLIGAAAASVAGFGATRAWGQGLGPPTTAELAAQAAASGRYAVDPNQVFDVIVVGAGTAGMPLAFQAATRGKVLVIERGAMLGGTLHLSGGMMSAGGTALQKRKDIVDSPQQLYDDSWAMSHGKANPETLRLYVDNAAQTIDWLERIGLLYPDYQPTTGVHAAFATRRYHGGPEGGRSLLKIFLPPFQQAEADGRIRVLLNARAVELTKDQGGAVTGIIVEQNGRRTQYRGRNVVMTAGGTIHNAANFKRYHNKGLFVQSGYEHSQGEGLNIGEAAGANISGGEKWIGHPGTIVQDRTFPSRSMARASIDPRRRKPGEILVNAEGERFVQEDTDDIDHFERQLTDQTNMAAWVIWDQKIYDQAQPKLLSGDLAQQQKWFDTHMMFARADTIEAAARKMGLPPEKVAATVADYNRVQKGGGSDKFGRTHRPLPIAEGPFYIVETYTSGVFTFAGLDVNKNLQVVTADKKPIPNLYAAGENIGGWQCAGDVVINGCMVTPAITFGRLLGERLLPIGQG